MRRLVSTIGLDIRLQVRNGFYYAAGFVAVFWAVALSRLSPGNVSPWIPVFILSNLLINGYYFMAGLMLLEKAEGTLTAQSVSPLRAWEYLTSKVLTLILVSSMETLVIVVFGYGRGFSPIGLFLGVMFSVGFFALAGFLVVIRYDSVNEFLFPSFLFTLFFVPPFLSYFGLIETGLIYLHPIQGSLLLTQAAFQRIESWKYVYALLSSLVWIGVAFSLSRKAFARFVVATEGD